MSILTALEQAEATIRERDAEIERLRNALLEMIEISKRNSDASLMLMAIRKCAQHALAQKP